MALPLYISCVLGLCPVLHFSFLFYLDEIRLRIQEFGCYILAIGDSHKELWGHCSYACGRERCSSWNGEDSKKEGKNVSRIL